MSDVPTQAELSSSLGLTFWLSFQSTAPEGDIPAERDQDLPGVRQADFPVKRDQDLRGVRQADFLRGVPATLAGVRDGIPMDDGYLCYSASFDLPPGIQLPQDLYRVTSPSGAAWDLLVTPTRPRADGVATMCAVFHVARPAAALACAGV